MPELPEVETIRRSLEKHILNKKIIDVIVRQEKLRWQIPKNLKTKLLHQKFQSISRRGKYLILKFANSEYLIIHLGMTGKLLLSSGQCYKKISSVEAQHAAPDEQLYKHEHVTFFFENGESLAFVDPRKFGSILLTQNDPIQHPLLASLGPEPLEKIFTGEYLYNVSRNKKVNTKQFLMNSKIVVGVGNIYANEALFSAKIDPRRQAKDLTKVECNRLAAIIKDVLRQAIKQGGTTIRDFAGSHGDAGNFQHELKVYGRGDLPCNKCGTKLTEIRLGQRTTVFCEICQK
jgi:formamidopyrimidine-DNA glycosylase